MWLLRRKKPAPRSITGPANLFGLSEGYPESELDLSRSIGVGGGEEICRPLVMTREVIDAKEFIALQELSGRVQKALVADHPAFVIATEQIKSLDYKLTFQAVTKRTAPRYTKIGRCVIRPSEAHCGHNPVSAH